MPLTLNYNWVFILLKIFFFVAKEISEWTPEDGSNVWEHSGLIEGDIMIYDSSQLNKNGVLKEDLHWPNATIPYYIDESFSE